ncbi:claudin-15-like isoform X2 [Bufo gargarizans]|uniref:claudin-15-like isoform X2 n=1 Tax=Bufo gargarizans TaxID=30331 RepID=UPI001CF29DE1|nr:claudin-15-like isoform X2 [Bufo gargarizans]
MSQALELVGFLMGLIGSLMSVVTLSSEKWKTSTLSGSVITSSILYENLWKSCAEASTGITNCKTFESLLNLPAHTQACRALMIISLILGLFGCIISLFGLKCTKFGSNNEHTKGKIALSGGLIFILAGLCCVVPVSWYAATITQQFYDSLYGGIKYELGPALYIGWAGSLLAIIGGSLLCCSFKAKQKTAKKPVYTYKAPDNEFTQFKEMRETSTARAYV